VSSRPSPIFFFFQAEDGIRDATVTGVQTCALPIVLSPIAPFAEAVTDADLVFVGPPAAAIRAMGDKTEARRRMQAAGVPIVPGTTRPVADHAQARSEAARLGYPVLLKAVAGGGGKG